MQSVVARGSAEAEFFQGYESWYPQRNMAEKNVKGVGSSYEQFYDSFV